MINYLMNYVRMHVKNEKGQGMVEYVLIIAFIAVVLIATLTAFKVDIAAVFTNAGDAINP